MIATLLTRLGHLVGGVGGYWMPAFAGMTPNARWD